MSSGLYQKYNVTRADGKPNDPNAVYFVLRIDKDPAAREALRAYAIRTEDPFLRRDLLTLVAIHESGPGVDDITRR